MTRAAAERERERERWSLTITSISQYKRFVWKKIGTNNKGVVFSRVKVLSRFSIAGFSAASSDAGKF